MILLDQGMNLVREGHGEAPLCPLLRDIKPSWTLQIVQETLAVYLIATATKNFVIVQVLSRVPLEGLGCPLLM